MRVLDFVVIGAQKAGTTTIFEHLRQHPELFIPPSKEAGFFSRPQLAEKGPSYLLKTFFSGASDGQLLGKVTPDLHVPAGCGCSHGIGFPEGEAHRHPT